MKYIKARKLFENNEVISSHMDKYSVPLSKILDKLENSNWSSMIFYSYYLKELKEKMESLTTSGDDFDNLINNTDDFIKYSDQTLVIVDSYFYGANKISDDGVHNVINDEAQRLGEQDIYMIDDGNILLEEGVYEDSEVSFQHFSIDGRYFIIYDMKYEKTFETTGIMYYE